MTENEKIYDVIILGAGPAGMSAGIYAGRAKLAVLIIDKGMDGGQIALTHNIENYPGQANTDGESGFELVAPMVRQYKRFNCERVIDTVTGCKLDGEIKELVGAKKSYYSKTVIFCTGAITRRLGLEEENRYIGKGVSYCAVCDGRFFEGKDIFAVGSNAVAVEEALYLSQFARKLTLIFKGSKLMAPEDAVKQLENAGNVVFMPQSEIVALSGRNLLEGITVKNTVTLKEEKITSETDNENIGLFVFTGKNTTGMLEGIVDTKDGFVITNDKMETNIPGVYAAGDVRVTPLRQVVTACADGAIAATECGAYIRRNTKK